MKKAAPAVLGALVLLLATACGGDGGSDDLTATITSNVAEGISSTEGILDADDAECVAEKFVDDRGVEALQDSKVVTEDGSYNENGANVDAASSAAYAKALLACVDQDEAIEKIEKSLVAGSSGAAIPAENARCYVGKLVATVDIEHLLSSRIITDSGELNENAAAPDPETAAKSTAALLGCIDYYALDARQRAEQTEGLSAAKYAACLRKSLPTSLLTKFLTSVQAQSADLKSLGERVNKKTETCAKRATAK